VSPKLPRRIGVNAIFLLPGMGGLDTYLRELMAELARTAPEVRFVLYCSPEGRRHLSDCDCAGSVRFVRHPLFRAADARSRARVGTDMGGDRRRNPRELPARLESAAQRQTRMTAWRT
jgi:hypothetical protein